MAQYYSQSDTDSYESSDGGEEYSNIDYGVYSLVYFGPPSHYQLGAGRRRREKEEEEGLYEMVGTDEHFSLYAKV